MKYGIISDIHGNQEALEVALQHLAARQVDEIICVGDMVGYGADPNGCVNRVKEVTDKIVAGNHDYAAVGLTSIDSFNDYAREAVLWTEAVLTEENKHFIRTLPFTLTLGEMLVVHASPHEPEQWHYLLAEAELQAAFRHFAQQVCLIGHSHQPLLFEEGRSFVDPGQGCFFSLLDSSRYIVNVGSVGQPRDHNPQLCCHIYDSEKRMMERIRLPYDISRAQARIRSAGLPEFLARRLAYGE